MPSQLYKNDSVSFLCGRNFVYKGVKYTMGSDFPQEVAVGRLESLVRSRYIIPVVDEVVDKPRHWHREVRTRTEVLAKMERSGVSNLLTREKQSGLEVLSGPAPEDKSVEETEDPGHTIQVEKELTIAEKAEAESRGDNERTMEEVLSENPGYDPNAHGVTEVMEYLTSNISTDEYNRVVAAERAGKARKGILDNV